MITKELYMRRPRNLSKKLKGMIAAAVLPLSLSQHLSLTMKMPSLLQGMAGGKEGNRVEAIGRKAGSVGDQGDGDQMVLNFQVQNIGDKEQGGIPTDRIRISDQPTK